MIGITERGDAALDHSWVAKIKETEFTVLITKDPELLYNFLKSLDYEILDKIIVHATITGYGGSFLEPGVKNVKESLIGYNKLIELLGISRVVLRIDPIIPIDYYLHLSLLVYDQRHKEGRVRISFIDQYKHVRERFQEVGYSLPWKTMHAPLSIRQEALSKFMRVEVCGEPDIVCTGCISVLDYAAFSLPLPESGKSNQRISCCCLSTKKELLDQRRPCKHGCLYCYWLDKK